MPLSSLGTVETLAEKFLPKLRVCGSRMISLLAVSLILSFLLPLKKIQYKELSSRELL